MLHTCADWGSYSTGKKAGRNSFFSFFFFFSIFPFLFFLYIAFFLLFSQHKLPTLIMGITTFSQNKWGGRSDFSRPSVSSTMTEEVSETVVTKISQPRFSAFGNKRFSSNKLKAEPVVTTTVVEEEQPVSQPRFSVFGKKAKFDSINQKSLEQDKKPVEKSNGGRFQLHLSSKTAANKQQEEQDLSVPNSPQHKKGKSVSFDALFLERVCLFREAQSPIELKEAHDKRLTNPPFRIICSNWPPQQTSDYYAHKNILLNKKTFYVQPDNSCIKGKLMIRNLALDKSVSIRYTFDCWNTIRDVDGVFFGPNPKNVAFDIYEFSMDLLGFGQLSDHGELRGKLEFAIRFTAGDKDYNDNNDGRNYQIKIICDPLNDPWANEKMAEKKEEKSSEKDEDEYPDEDEEEEEEEEDICIEEEENEKHNSFTNALKGYKHAKPVHLNKRQPWLGTRYDFGQSLSMAKRAPYESWSNTVKADPRSITDYFLVKPISIKPTTPTTVAAGPALSPDSSSNTTKSTPFTIRPVKRRSSLVSFSNYPQLSQTTSTPTTTTTPTASKTEEEKELTITLPHMFTSSSAPPSPSTSPKMTVASPIRPTLHHSSHSTSAVIPTLSTSTTPLDINSSYYLDLVNKYCFYSSSTTSNNQPIV